MALDRTRALVKQRLLDTEWQGDINRLRGDGLPGNVSIHMNHDEQHESLWHVCAKLSSTNITSQTTQQKKIMMNFTL